MNAHEFAKQFNVKLSPTGSNYICNPPVTDTDVDYVVKMGSEIEHEQAIKALVEAGWERGGSNDPLNLDYAWGAYRKGVENLIVTYRAPFYDSFVAATEIAKEMNLRAKSDRVTLFRMLRDRWPGMYPTKSAASFAF